MMKQKHGGVWIRYTLDGDEWTEFYTDAEQDEVMNENRGYFINGWTVMLGTDMFEQPLPPHILEIVDGGLL